MAKQLQQGVGRAEAPGLGDYREPAGSGNRQAGKRFAMQLDNTDAKRAQDHLGSGAA